MLVLLSIMKNLLMSGLDQQLSIDNGFFLSEDRTYTEVMAHLSPLCPKAGEVLRIPNEFLIRRPT